MGGIGAFAEPLVVVTLLIGGAWINRDHDPGRRLPKHFRRVSEDDIDVEEGQTRISRTSEIDAILDEDDVEHRSSSPSLLTTSEPKWRRRKLRIWGFEKSVITPNSRRFKSYFLSRLLERFPFLVECWYWALIYWVCHI